MAIRMTNSEDQGLAGPAPGRAAPTDPFRIDHLQADLKGRSVRGGILTVTAQGARFALQLSGMMILARLLTPADFGLIAMVAVLTVFLGLFKDLGLSMATIQRARIDHHQVSTLFWINVGFSLALVMACASMAPAVAWFFDEPRLRLITVLVGLQFLFAGLGAQHVALLRRQMRFKALAAIEIFAQGAAVSAAVALALLGAGYWALVALVGVQTFSNMAGAWALSRWRPGWGGRWRDAWEMIRFGGHLTGFNVVNYFSRNMDNLLIGATWGAGSLGIYSKAYGLLMLPLNQVNGPLSAVAIGGLSRLQEDPERMRRYYGRMIQVIAYATMPMVIVMAILSEQIVLIVLGEQWIEAALIFRIFAFFAIGQSIWVTSGWLMISLGQTDRMLKWAVFQSLIIVTAFMIGLRWGPVGVALAATIAGNLMVLPTLAYAFYRSPIMMRDVAAALGRPVAMAGLVLLAGLAAHVALGPHHMAFQVGGVLAATAMVGALGWVLPPVREDLRRVVSVRRRGQ